MDLKHKNPGSEHKGNRDITLVRAADGDLYLLNDTTAPMKLEEDEAEKVTKILEDTEKKLTEIIRKKRWFEALSCSNFVKVMVPEVFLHGGHKKP